jgi:hypothetical protein
MLRRTAPGDSAAPHARTPVYASASCHTSIAARATLRSRLTVAPDWPGGEGGTSRYRPSRRSGRATLLRREMLRARAV